MTDSCLTCSLTVLYVPTRLLISQVVGSLLDCTFGSTQIYSYSSWLSDASAIISNFSLLRIQRGPVSLPIENIHFFCQLVCPQFIQDLIAQPGYGSSDFNSIATRPIDYTPPRNYYSLNMRDNVFIPHRSMELFRCQIEDFRSPSGISGDFV